MAGWTYTLSMALRLPAPFCEAVNQNHTSPANWHT
jgi:hypothetical protein